MRSDGCRRRGLRFSFWHDGEAQENGVVAKLMLGVAQRWSNFGVADKP